MGEATDAGCGSACDQVRLYDIPSGTFRTLTSWAEDHFVQRDAPVFSPDGQRLLYQVSGDFGPALVVRDLTGGFRRVLKNERVCPQNECSAEWTGYWESPEKIEQAAFSPDGQTVAMHLRWNPQRATERHWSGLYTVNVASGAPSVVAESLGFSQVQSSQGLSLDWLPGTQGLVYLSARMPAGIYLWSPQQQMPRLLSEVPDTAGLWAAQGLLTLSPSGRSLFLGYTPGLEGAPRQVWRVPSTGGALVPFYAPPGRVHGIGWSPRGSFFIANVEFDDGSWAGPRRLTTVQNLGARLSASRAPGAAVLTLKGTAADLNFESYELTARPLPTGTPAKVIARSAQPVINDTLAEWAPSVPGLYEITLTVHDKAGNMRSRTTKVVWTTVPALANLWREPEYLSPNGDGVQDSARVRYATTEPLTPSFEFVSSSGERVRRITEARPSPGEYSFLWDGRSDAGAYVEDGVYMMQTVGGSLRFVVDRTEPQAEFVFASTLAHGPAPSGSEPDLVWFSRPAVVMPGGSIARVPSLTLVGSWRAEDTHLAGWTLELGAARAERGFSELESGTAPVTEGHFLWLEQLRGRTVRLRAWDKAGNEKATSPQATPEVFKLLALGPAEMLESAPGKLVLEGKELPRIDVLRPLMDETGIPQDFDFEPLRYAFAFTHSSDAPLVEFSVRYTPLSGGTVVTDTRNISVLGDSVVLWDARQVPPDSYYVQVQARAADGQQFSATVQMARSGGNKRIQLFRCMKAGRGQDAVKLQLLLQNLDMPLLMPGATVSAFAEGQTTPEKTFALGPLAPGAPAEGAVLYEAELQTAQLTQCRYALRFDGQTLGGRQIHERVGVNLCGTFIEPGVSLEGSTAALALSETFRKPVASVELFLRPEADPNWTPAGTLGAFQGLSARVSMPLEAKNACGKQQVRTLTHFSDGSVADSTDFSDQLCQPNAFEVPCTVAKVDKPRRLGTASMCAMQTDPEFTVDLGAKAGAGAEVRELTAFLQPLSGGAPLPLLLAPYTAGPEVNTQAIIPTASLPEGLYQVGLEARDSRGYAASALSDSESLVIVDHQLPIVTVASPKPDEVLCPALTRGVDGRLVPRLEVKGTLQDSSLERYAVMLAPEGQTPVERLVGPEKGWDRNSGRLGAIDMSGMTAGPYTLRVSAWDSSGSSACSEPIAFRYVTGISLRQVEVTPGLFSPDGDGQLDTTSFSAELGEAASQATLAVVPVSSNGTEGAPLGNVFSGALGLGARTVSWNGADPRTGGRAADGEYVLRLTVRDACGNAAMGSGHVLLDTQAPVATFSAPTEEATVGAALTVYGEASDANLTEYRLQVGPSGAGASGFTPVNTAYTSVKGGVLGVVDTAALSPGKYTLLLTVRDGAGHTQTASREVTVSARDVLEGLRLARSVLSPANGDDLGDETQVLFGLRQRASITLEVLSLGGQSLGTLLSSVEYAPTTPEQQHAVTLGLDVLRALEDGTYRVRLTAVGAGSTEVDELPLTLDRKRPVIAVSSPRSGGDERGPSVEVVGSISDDRLISWTVLHTPPGGTAAPVASGRAPPFGVLATLKSLAQGEHTLTLDAWDGAENFTRQVVSFRVDTTPPQVAFTSPANEAMLSGGSGPVSVRATLTEERPKRLSLALLRDGVSKPLALFEALPADGILTTWSSPESLPADGTATLLLEAEDQAGNTAESQLSVTFDKTKPVAHIDSPRNELLLASGAIRGTAWDEHLERYTLELSDGEPNVASRFVPLATGTSSVQSAPLAVLDAPLADGMYTLRLTVRDLAGNESVDMAGFRVDNTPPPAPTGAVATVQRPDDVTLTWTPDTSGDATGYRILRARGDAPFVALTSTPVVGNTFTDSNVADGTWRYAVVAVDAAGLSSEPSAEARVVIDATPPTAFLTLASGARVSGSVELRGSAYSPEDFREYRLFARGPGGATDFVRFASGSAPVQSGLLGVWNSAGLDPDSVWTLRLEAEDLSGNVASSTVTVTVDNAPPAAPVLQTPQVSGTSVTLQWSKGAEAPDLAGFLVLRDGSLVNAPEGVSISDFGPYLLPPNATSYVDSARPDGTFAYQLFAVDTAGNLSPPSETKSVSLDTHAPRAVVTSPVALGRLSGPVWVYAQSTDEDLAGVQLEARALNAEKFTALAPPSTHSPFGARLDPADFAGASILELHAVAWDKGGKKDAEPESVFVFVDSSLTPPTAVAQVDGNKVTVSWTDSQPSSRVWTHEVRRGTTVVGSGGTLTGATARSNDTAPGSNAAWAYDGNVSTAWTSVSGLPRTWETGLWGHLPSVPPGQRDAGGLGAGAAPGERRLGARERARACHQRLALVGAALAVAGHGVAARLPGEPGGNGLRARGVAHARQGGGHGSCGGAHRARGPPHLRGRGGGAHRAARRHGAGGSDLQAPAGIAHTRRAAGHGAAEGLGRGAWRHRARLPQQQRGADGAGG